MTLSSLSKRLGDDLVISYVAHMNRPLPQTDLEWKNYFREQLDDPGTDFVAVTTTMLIAIRDASTENKPRLAPKFGGFLRRLRCSARVDLTKGILEQLKITSTQHVASMVMKRIFKTAADIAVLNRHFALAGRDATEKHTAAALLALDDAPGVVKRYADLYDWYNDELKRRVDQLKTEL
jgi:hypothetical protein